MKLKLVRDTFTDLSTVGRMWVNGVDKYNTLEDRDRHLEDGREKVLGATCIPRGTYVVELNKSGRFGKQSPEIKNVPGFTHIRIHPLNWSTETEGCVGVGLTRAPDFIGKSTTAYQELRTALMAAVAADETIIIEVT
jgi:hypothetical protein